MFRFTKHQYLIYGILGLGNFGSSMCVSLQSPFFPYEAELKGATPTQYGFVFGVFELVVFIMGPLYGNFMEHIGPNFMCIAGTFFTGSTCVLFGQLDKIQGTEAFIGMAFAIRITEALGNAGFISASFSIIAKVFPEDTGIVFASQESFYGLGMILGPTIGGALYSVGGYSLPFTCLGAVLVAISIFGAVFMPRDRKGDATITKGSVIDALKIKSMAMMMFAVASTSYGIGCIQVGLEPHLRQFGLNPFQVGLMFIISGLSYLISAPLWGKLIDKYCSPKYIIAIGGVFMTLSFILVGPVPFLPFKPTLWMIIASLFLQGIGFGSEFVGGYIGAQRDAIKSGMPDDLNTYGIISGLWMSSFAFGAFVGPTVSGYIMEEYGFEWATMVPVILHVIVTVTHLCYQWYNIRTKKGDEDKTALTLNGRVYGSTDSHCTDDRETIYEYVA